MEQLRQTILSRTAILSVNASYGRDENAAYLLVRQIACQYKHPIILNYKQQLTNIRVALKLKNKRFRQLMKIAEQCNFIKGVGKHIALLSKTQDRKQFKKSNKNDYHLTSNPSLFREMVLLSNYHSKQTYLIKQKRSQPDLVLNNSDRSPNYSITLSCKAASNLLQLNSTSQARKRIVQLSVMNLIKLNDREQTITRREFDHALKKNDRTIRYDKPTKRWYRVLASTFEVNFNFNRVVFSKFDRLPEQTQIMYLEMGYTIEQVDRLIA